MLPPSFPRVRLPELRELINRYDSHAAEYRTASGGYNEHSCRVEFINPFLKILGWDVENTKGVPPRLREVIPENYLEDSGRPDYSMNLHGNPKFFIEAKKPSVDIVDNIEPALQSRTYGWNANHLIAVLTNFEDLVIYDATIMPEADDISSVARYRRYHYTEYEENIDEIYALLSRESVYLGYFDEHLSAEMLAAGAAKSRLDKVFLDQINDWRIKLADCLRKNDPWCEDLDMLSDAIQSFIDQMIFLRICEDRNLPLYCTLEEVAKDEDHLLDGLIKLLMAADAKYDSGLFSEMSEVPYIDDNLLLEIITGLYYPKSPYLFSIIDPSILGQIYELFLAEQIDFDEGGRAYLVPKDEYKDRSVVTTPLELVRYMVHRAVGPLVEGKSPDEIAQVRVADISCGSGVFLLEAYQVIQDACVSWYREHDLAHLQEIGNGEYVLSFAEKKHFLESCIYGIDIDSHAVEIAQFSLMVKLIENENAATVSPDDLILPDLTRNIVLGNALVSPEEAIAHEATGDDFVGLVPFGWQTINGGQPFDAIIGNPPYVKTADMKNLLPEVEFKIYKSEYESAYKQFDKYFLFIERALAKVKPDGYVCLIVPNKFFKIGAGQKLRELIAFGRHLVSLDDFGDAQLFESRTIYSCILCLRKQEQPEFEYASVQIADDLWVRNEEKRILLPAGYIGDDVWWLTTDIHLIEKIRDIQSASVPITRYIFPCNGIQTSAETNRTYWFLESEIVKESADHYVMERDGRRWPIEKSILRSYFKPTEEHGFNTYSPLACDKLIIFPYDREGELIPLDAMVRDYPGAYAYLESRKAELWPKKLSGQGEDNLEGVRDIPDATLETWYQYGRTQALARFNDTEKIIVGVLSEQPLYYIDRNEWLIASGGTAGYCAIMLNPGCPYSLEYIQAWLTNEHTEKMFEVIGSDFEGGFKSRGTSLLEQLPFVELDFDDPEQRALHDEVTELSRRVQKINEELSKPLSRRIATVRQREKNDAIAKIADLIDRVYSLEFA